MPLKPPQTEGLYQLVGALCVCSAECNGKGANGLWKVAVSESTPRTADCRKTLQERSRLELLTAGRAQPR